MEINEYEVYTLKEAKILLKISLSTLVRMIKKGAIQTAKVGKQYRILGKELLRLVSPTQQGQVTGLYGDVKR